MSNKIAKMLAEEEDATWLDILPAATEAANNMLQESLSDGDAWMAPSEIWFARNPVLQSLPVGRPEAPTGMKQYVRRLRRRRNAVQQFVKESTRLYHQKMKERDRNRNNMLRVLQEGDAVTYFKPSTSKRLAKVMPKQQGPYKVIKVHEDGVQHTIKRIGSKNKTDLLKVHVDHLRKLKRFKDETPQVEHPAKTAASKRSKTFDVQEVCGERVSAQGQKQYLIRWEGYDECTWEPNDNLSCSDKVSKWTQLSMLEQRARYNAACRQGIAAAV